MTLSAFIQENMDVIVQEWLAFAHDHGTRGDHHERAGTARPRQADPARDREGPGIAASRPARRKPSPRAGRRPVHARNGSGHARRPAAGERVRPEPAGRRIPRIARERDPPVDAQPPRRPPDGYRRGPDPLQRGRGPGGRGIDVALCRRTCAVARHVHGHPRPRPAQPAERDQDDRPPDGEDRPRPTRRARKRRNCSAARRKWPR